MEERRDYVTLSLPAVLLPPSAAAAPSRSWRRVSGLYIKCKKDVVT